MKITLKNYADELVSLFDVSRAEYVQLSSEIRGLNEAIKKVGQDSNLSRTGISARQADLKAQRHELLEKRKQISVDAETQIDEIKGRARTTFGDYFEISPSKVDEKFFLLLNKNALSDSDLIRLASGEYRDNCTMRSVVSQELRSRGMNTSNQNLVTAANQIDKSIDYLSGLDSVGNWILCALNPDEDTANAYSAHLVPNVAGFIADLPTVAYISDATKPNSGEYVTE